MLLLFRVCHVVLFVLYSLIVNCWEGTKLLALLYVMFSCVLLLYVVPWVRYGAWLYRFLIFAIFLTSTTETNLTSKLLKQVYRYHKLRKTFTKFYYRHSELIVKCNICLITLLQQGISEPVFYGDLVHKFKSIIRKPSFSDHFKMIIKHYKRVGYNMDIMRQSACQVVYPITVYSYGILFNSTMLGQASDSMTALT